MESLQDFIDRKITELEHQFKSVNFDEAINVFLSKNSCSENFISEKTSLSTIIEEINLSDLPDARQKYINPKPNGSKVKFDVIPKGKRKSVKKEYYVIWR